MSQKIHSTSNLYRSAVIIQKAFLKNSESLRLELFLAEGVIQFYMVHGLGKIFYQGDDLDKAIESFNTVLEADEHGYLQTVINIYNEWHEENKGN